MAPFFLILRSIRALRSIRGARKIDLVARFLIVGRGARAQTLAELVRGNGHLATAIRSPARDALEHVTIVCWLEDASPERFLERAVDSSMRGFLCEGSQAPAVARRNRIPVALLSQGIADDREWLCAAAAGIAMLGIPLKDDRLSQKE